jgi:hypothetical protein
METNAYDWVLWLHILSAFVFFFIHGTSLAIAFRLPQEKTLDGMRALLNITGMTIPFFYGSFLLLQAFGILLTFWADWWQKAWPWISFVLLNAMTIWMTWYARKFYGRLRKALGMPYMTGASKEREPVEPASLEEIRTLLESTDPKLLTWVGGIVSAAVLWLMVFKPF